MTSIARLTLPQDIQALLDQSARRVGVPLQPALQNRSLDAATGDESNVIPFRRTAR